MSARLGLICIVLVGVGFAAYVVTRRVRAPAVAVEVSRPDAETSGDGRASLAGSSGVGSDSARDVSRRASVSLEESTAAAVAGLQVRSSAGIELDTVWVGPPGDDALRRSLDADGWTTGSLPPPPFTLRAAGHVDAYAAPDTRTVVLEPDCLLVVAFDGVAELEPEFLVFPDVDGSVLREVDAWGAFSRVATRNEWAFAVRVEALSSVFREQVDVEVELQHGRSVEVCLTPEPGLRAFTELPRLAPLESAPVELTVAGGAAAETLLTLRVRSKPRLLSREEMSWGAVSIYDTAFSREVTFVGDRVVIDDVPLGYECEVRARRPEVGTYGCARFVHTGARQAVELQPGFVLSGRLVSSDGGAVGEAFMIWNLPGREDRARWHGPWSGRADGVGGPLGFSIGMPTGMPCSDGVDEPLPNRIRLKVDARFHDPVVFVREVRPGTNLDLGEVILKRRSLRSRSWASTAWPASS